MLQNFAQTGFDFSKPGSDVSSKNEALNKI